MYEHIVQSKKPLLMKQNFTMKGFFRKKERWLLPAIFGLLVVFGCYEFKLVDQPTEGTTNSTFDVLIVMAADADGSNDFTDESGDLADNKGLFGVLLPEGWTIRDSIEIKVEAADSLQNSSGDWVVATTDHSGTYYWIRNDDQTQMLNDTVGASEGYYWWGAKSGENIDLAFFDSLQFTVTVMTSDTTGTFYLQYAVGDEDDPIGRAPYDKSDPAVLTDPLPITITEASGVNLVLDKADLSVYPNPSYGFLNIELEKYNGDPVDMAIYDIRGKQVMAGQLGSARTTLDLLDLKPGIYVLRLEYGNEALTRKFVLN